MFSTARHHRPLPPFRDDPSGPPPPVSIGVPVFNGAEFLDAALAGILNQTFDDFELLISDNASTDDTEAICRAAAASDPRIRYDRLPSNLGAAANYNRLVHAARGRWFRWASHDDLIDPPTIERLVEHFQVGNTPVLAYPKTILIDHDDNVLREHEDRLDIRDADPAKRVARVARRWSMCNPVFGLIEREQLLRTDLIGPYIGSDVTLLAQLAVLGEFHEVPERTFRRRIHAASSRQGELSLDDVAVWFDTSKRRASRLKPANVVMLEILRSFRESDLSRVEKARCCAAYCATWEFRNARMRGGRLKRRVRGWLDEFGSGSGRAIDAP